MNEQDVVCPHCDKQQKVVEKNDPGHQRATCASCTQEFLMKMDGSVARTYKPGEEENK